MLDKLYDTMEKRCETCPAFYRMSFNYDEFEEECILQKRYIFTLQTFTSSALDNKNIT